MKLSTKGRYGLRAMIDLAQYSEHEAVSISSISQRQNISESYLEQLVAKLRKAELVTGILAKSGKFAPALIIGGETIIDVAVDKGTSVVFDREFDLKMSLLTSLASNIAFSIDPVNMATGGFCLTAT